MRGHSPEVRPRNLEAVKTRSSGTGDEVEMILLSIMIYHYLGIPSCMDQPNSAMAVLVGKNLKVLHSFAWTSSQQFCPCLTAVHVLWDSVVRTVLFVPIVCHFEGLQECPSLSTGRNGTSHTNGKAGSVTTARHAQAKPQNRVVVYLITPGSVQTSIFSKTQGSQLHNDLIEPLLFRMLFVRNPVHHVQIPHKHDRF